MRTTEGRTGWDESDSGLMERSQRVVEGRDRR